MSGDNVTLAFSISKEAFEKIQAGSAVLSSGGVRVPNGELMELAKPALNVAQNTANGAVTLGPAGAATQLASSVASNIQLHKLSKSVEALQSSVNILQGLSCVNIALTAINIGVSVYGFHKTFKMLGEISQQVNEVLITAKQVKDMLDENLYTDYKEIIRNIENSYFALTKNQVSVNMETAPGIKILGEIEHGVSLLESVIRRFNNKLLHGEIALPMIITLAISLSVLIKEYSSRYYYEYNEFPHHLEKWTEIINKIRSAEFKKTMVGFLNVYYGNLSPEDRLNACKLTILSVADVQAELSFGLELCQRIPCEQYMNLPEFLNKQLNNGKYRINKDEVLIKLT